LLSLRMCYPFAVFPSLSSVCRRILYRTILYYTKLHNTTLRCTTPHYTTLYFLHFSTQYWTKLYYTILFCASLSCITQNETFLYCNILYYTYTIQHNTTAVAVRSRGSAVSIVSMDWTTGVRSPTEAEDFSSSLCVQTGSGANPTSCTMGTGGKARSERDADR
jgi:hypothetical protein